MTFALRHIRLSAIIYDTYGYGIPLKGIKRHRQQFQLQHRSEWLIANNNPIYRYASSSPSDQPKKTSTGVSTPPPPPQCDTKSKNSSTSQCNSSSINKITWTSSSPSASSQLPSPSDLSNTSSTTKDPTTAPSAATPQSMKQKLSREALRQNVQGYVFTRYVDVVKNYDKVLEKNFPSAVKVYRIFFDGVKDFYADMKRYLKISRLLNSSAEGLKALNRKELELYMQMPRDMVKVAPALLISSLPMVGYAIFPLVFMYPRTFLTTHFWSLQQRAEFQQLKIQERLCHNRPVFRCLQAKLHMVSSDENYSELDNILGLIGSGFHPTVQSLLKVKNIFAKPPYNLMSLSGKHIKLLCQMHGVPGGWFKRHRLSVHAFLVHHMDLAIGREGGVHNMHPDAIRYSCFIRGLNPSNLSNEEMIEWLRNWIEVSTTIEEQHLSLFLHLPIFLAYNHPNNWQLIYGNAMPK